LAGKDDGCGVEAFGIEKTWRRMASARRRQ